MLKSLGIRARIVALCIISLVVLTVLLLLIVQHGSRSLSGAISADYQSQAERTAQLAASDLKLLVTGLQEATLSKLTGDSAVICDFVTRAGGLQLTSQTTTWNATNQLSRTKTSLELPTLRLGASQLTASPAPEAIALLDPLKKMVGSDFTIFQRMNEAGDMLRVCTTLQPKPGKRAVGTFVPATLDDGSPNPLTQTILKGEAYSGRAYVVNRWCETRYVPQLDAQGKVIGMLFCGIPQENVAALRDGIGRLVVGKTGRAIALGAAGADRGKLQVTPVKWPQTAGDAWDAGQPETTRADLKKFLDKVTTADSADPLVTTVEWAAADGKPQRRVLAAVYFKPWEWVFCTQLPEADFIDDLRHVQVQFSHLNYQIMIGGALLIIIVGAITLVMCRRLLAPLGRISARLCAIAEGDGDLTQRLPIDRHDEIGELSGYFNRFIIKIQSIIREVKDTSMDVSHASDDIAATSHAMAEHLRHETANLEQISAAISELSSSVTEVAQQTTHAAEQAQLSGQQARNGGQVVEKTVHSMHQLHDTVEAGTTSVNALGEQSQKIGQIISIINDIAEQTNLLALNAAIEAARAGEHGRGFAVVADEVRKLADRTTQATGEVAQVITGIKDETRQAIERMAAGTDQVAGGVQCATEAGTSLSQIVTSTDQVSGMIQTIAAAIEEQSSVSDEINRSVQALNDLTRDVSENACQAADTATSLAHQADRLQTLVGQFKA
jgi:methyl-accepting chemotaxis protein